MLTWQETSGLDRRQASCIERVVVTLPRPTRQLISQHRSHNSPLFGMEPPTRTVKATALDPGLVSSAEAASRTLTLMLTVSPARTHLLLFSWFPLYFDPV